VKIGSFVSELLGLESRPLKKLKIKNEKEKKTKEKTSAKYIALPASMPSGLNNNVAKNWQNSHNLA